MTTPKNSPFENSPFENKPSNHAQHRVQSKVTKAQSPWWVYMVQTQSGKLYTGITTNVQRRFHEHCQDKAKQARFFRSDPAKALVYWQPQADRSSASQAEAKLKKLPRQAKLALVTTFAKARLAETIA